MSDETINRRDFLKTAAAAAAAPAVLSIVPRRVLGLGQTPPSDRLNVAGIGVGGKGADDLAELDGENIVALCDVDPNYAAKTIARYPGIRFYTDYRVMLEKQKDIDAVVIATPDHTHAVITLAAMQLGKHVYTQKPLTHNVWESRMLARAARDSKVTTQMGIQGHSGEGMRLISEWIAAGLIGEVTEVDAWCSLSYYPWGHAYWSTKWGDRPTDTPPVPAGMDWDLWIGPAPMRPYHPAYHPLVWRCWWDFGVGMMGDRGVHTLDPVYYALELGAPSSVEATVCALNPETHPLANVVTYRFPKRGKRPPVKLTWYDGLRAPKPEDLEDSRNLPAEGGSLFKGTKGKIMAGIYGESPRIIPERLMQAVKLPPKTIPRVEGSHEKEWARACKAGVKAVAPFEYAGPLTEVCLLGNVAKRLDGRIYWDAAKMKVTNNPEAEPLIRRPYREGWSL